MLLNEDNTTNSKASKENGFIEGKLNSMREKKSTQRHTESDEELGDDEDEDVVYNVVKNGIKIELNDSGAESGSRSRHTISNNKINRNDTKFGKHMQFVKEEEDEGCLKIYKFMLLNISFFLYVRPSLFHNIYSIYIYIFFFFN